jgi:hypothetical protein
MLEQVKFTIMCNRNNDEVHRVYKGSVIVVEQASELLPGVALYNTDDISKISDFWTQLLTLVAIKTMISLENDKLYQFTINLLYLYHKH